jgi:O-antigen/teichoic acid export membrane protein
MLVRQSFVNLACRFLYAGLMFGITAYVARNLALEEFGRFSIIFSLISITAIIVQFGMPVLLIRQYSKSRESLTILMSLGRYATKALIRSLSALTGIGLLALILAYACGLFGIWNSASLVLASGSLIVSNHYAARLRGLGSVFFAVAPETIIRPFLYIGAMVLFFVIFKLEMTVARVISIYAISVLLAALVTGYLYHVTWTRIFASVSQKKIITPSQCNGILPLDDFKSARKSFALLSISDILMTNLDVMIIGALVDSSDAGGYRLMVQLVMICSIALAAFNQVLQPKISRMYADGQIIELSHLLRKYVFILTVISMCLSLPIFLFGDSLIALVFGEKYVAYGDALTILLSAQVANVMFGPVATLLNMTGSERRVYKTMLAALSLNVFSSVLLITLFGYIGGAVASILTTVYWNYSLCAFSKRTLGINPSIFFLGGEA